MNIVQTQAAAVPAAQDDADGAQRVRACVPADLPAVASLFAKTFKTRSRAGAPRLETYLNQVFFQHPWRDPRIDPLVFVDANEGVIGFVGVHPLRLSFRGQPILAAVAGSLMVDRPAENPMAGARLMRSFLNGPQDISLSESANAVSQRMWERLGGKTVPAYSMEFLRVFRPSGFALALGAERARALRLLRPVAGGVDAIATRLSRGLFRPEAASAETADVGDSEIAEVVAQLSAGYPLRPQWDRQTLLWLLSHAAEKDRFGSLTRRVVLGRNDAPVGAYLTYVRPRGIAYVLQMLARPDSIATVADSLLAHAFASGAVAVRGRVQPEFADALLRRRAIFVHVASTLVRSKREDLTAAVRSGDALVTGLAAESWSQLIGGAFG